MRGLITKPTYEGYIGHKYTKIAVKTLQSIKEFAVFLPQKTFLSLSRACKHTHHIFNALYNHAISRNADEAVEPFLYRHNIS